MRPRIPVRQFLANLPLFREVPQALLDQLAADTSSIEAARHTVLFERGHPCSGFHAVVFGQVKLGIRTPQGDEKVVEIIGPGQTFGEAVMFLDRPYPVTAVTLQDSKLLHITREALLRLADADPLLTRRMLGSLSARLHQLMAQLEAVSLQSGAQRVLGYMLQSEPAGEAGGPVRVVLPVSKALLASHLNLTPEHFSRILHDLVAAGLLRVDGRNIEIPDVDRLRQYGGVNPAP